MRGYCCVALMLVAFLARSSPAQDAASKELVRRSQDYYQKVANDYEFFLSSDKETKLQVSKNSVLDYVHPSEMNGTNGSFFVWTKDGRPEIIGSIWSYLKGDKRTVVHEFHSLSLDRIMPVDVGTARWAPKIGIRLRPVPGAPVPHTSAALRLGQMRTLSRQFIVQRGRPN